VTRDRWRRCLLERRGPVPEFSLLSQLSYISFQIIIIKPMSQTKEQIEQELQSFKDANLDWRSVEWKSNTVTGFNNRLATFTCNYISF
jgi:hypothetical protein